jgi:2-dehydropantoate 2-reductase
MKKIALLGAGATGTIMGALIAKGGEDIVLVSAQQAHVNTLNKNGATITGGMEINIPVKAVMPNKLQGLFDLVIYSVKSTSDDIALSQLVPHLHKNSVVLTTQNGVPEEKIASYVGKERTLGGSIVGWAASLDAPGIARLAGKPNEMTYKIGELDGSITPRIKAVQNVLNHAGTAVIVEDLAGMRWTKLLINVSMSGLSAALGCTFGFILDNEKAIETALSLKVETLKTAQALGINLESVISMSPESFLTTMKENPQIAKKALRDMFYGQRNGKSSMLQDLEKGNKTEVESINGYLGKKAKEAGVATPVNDSVLAIIRAIQNGDKKLDTGNLDQIELKPFTEIL